jgi:hypothetical protein
MGDILVSIALLACIGGLFYGAYHCIAYGGDAEPARETERYDPVTLHTWPVPQVRSPTPRAHRPLLRPAPPAAQQRIDIELRELALELRADL